MDQALHISEVEIKNILSNPILHILLDTLSVGIAFLDSTGTYIYVNTSYVSHHGGKSKEDYCGKHVKELFLSADDGCMKVLRLHKKVISPSVSYTGSKGICSRIPILDENNNVLCIVTETIATNESEESLNHLIKTLKDLQDKANYYQQVAQNITGMHTFDSIIGESESMNQLKIKGKKYAQTSHPILITGESGTGKELMAQALHNASLRSQGVFISVNCAALPKDLLEAELFGYIEGAFTGSRHNGMKGKFESANKGTIFLDEIAEIPLEMQAKLLRVLESGEIQKLGKSNPIYSDFRVISATNHNLEDMVSQGTFREDLYHRLCTLEIHLPPLRERKEDIPLLSDILLKKILGREQSHDIHISSRCMEVLFRAQWHGNIRELRNVLTSSVCSMNQDETELDIKHLPSRFMEQLNNNRDIDNQDNKKVLIRFVSDTAERDLIISTLERCNKNKSMAATLLGISRVTLYNKIKKYKI